MTVAELKATKSHRWWHEAIIDDMLVYPLDTLEARGKRLNYSASYLCILMNTDMFKAAYERRRKDFKETMDTAILNKTTQVAAKGLDIMLEVLEQKRAQIPFAALSETVDKTLQRLGYGVQPRGPTVQVNAGNGAQIAVLPTVTAEQLTSARAALRAAEGQRAIESERSEKSLPGEKSLTERKQLEDGVLDLTPENLE